MRGFTVFFVYKSICIRSRFFELKEHKDFVLGDHKWMKVRI